MDSLDSVDCMDFVDSVDSIDSIDWLLSNTVKILKKDDFYLTIHCRCHWDPKPITSKKLAALKRDIRKIAMAYHNFLLLVGVSSR